MTLEDIKRVVTQLSPEQLAEFRAWFEEFDGAIFDAKIARDSRQGRLDRFAEEAIRDFREGRARKI